MSETLKAKLRYASTAPSSEQIEKIKKILEKRDVKITRIATGIPMGTDIEYIDAITLEFALEGRKDIQ